MSKLHGGRVASAVALMFAAGGVAAAEPAGSAEVTVVPDTMCGFEAGTTETICGRMVMPIGMCARATEPEEQPSTWCLIATDHVTEPTLQPESHSDLKSAADDNVSAD